MTQKLNAQIDELYGLPLEEFTKARNTVAKGLSGTEKKQVGSLVKPSLPVWIINQLFWHDAPTYKALIDAAEKLRAAHRLALSGGKADTRKPDQLHRTTVEKAFARAIGLAEKRGVRLTDSVRETVRRTLAALPSDETPGRLTRPPEPAGFSLLSGVQVRKVARPAEAAKERRTGKKRSRAKSATGAEGTRETGARNPKGGACAQRGGAPPRRAEEVVR